jgi:hypothetical protein
MRIAIELNGVLRDTLKKIQQEYEKWYLENPFKEDEEKSEYEVISDLTTLDISNMDYLQYLYVSNNLLTASVNNSLLTKLAANELSNGWAYGEFYTTGGRTSAGTTDYDYLIANGWTIEGADLVTVVRKLRVKGVGQINPNI